jgi:hypothetical protein
VVRRHPDVGHYHVRLVLLDRGAKAFEVAAVRDQLDPLGSFEHARDRLASEEAVFARTTRIDIRGALPTLGRRSPHPQR